ISSGNLSQPSYPSSGIANEVTLTTSGQDVNHSFTSQSSGSVYAATLINLSAASTGDYFFHVGPTNQSTLFFGRTFAKNNGSNFQLGLAFSSSGGSGQPAGPVYSPTLYTYGQTYLIVVKYTFNGGVNDDVVSLFINPAIGASEPT